MTNRIDPRTVNACKTGIRSCIYALKLRRKIGAETISSLEEWTERMFAEIEYGARCVKCLRPGTTFSVGEWFCDEHLPSKMEPSND